jgi:NDP-sugar pyrophosphorylase family protein
VNGVASEFPTVLILAGGMGTRLGSVYADRPKAMVPVAGMPFIAHQLRLLKREGVQDVVLSVSHMSEQIENYVGDGNQFGLSVRYSHDGAAPLGTGGACRKALPLLPDEFAILYGDTYLDINFAPIFQLFQNCGKNALITVLANADQWDKSNMLFRDGVILAYEKVSPSPEMKHIDYGLMLLKKSVLSAFFQSEPFDLSVVITGLITQNQLAGYEVTKRFYEIGTPAALAETEEYLLSRA